jgi:hypothetical protein
MSEEGESATLPFNYSLLFLFIFVSIFHIDNTNILRTEILLWGSLLVHLFCGAGDCTQPCTC